MSDDFQEELLTGDGKWWEFLDPQTYEVRDDLPQATQSSADQLDWSRRKQRRGPVGFSFFIHCDVCGHGIPPDFTFCVRCGGAPRSRSIPRTFTVVVAELNGPTAREMAGELIVAAGQDLKGQEVDALLSDLPAVFNVHGPKDRVAALAAKMSEIGIASRAFCVDDPSVPWLRETAESMIRQTPKLVTTLAVLALGAGLGWFWSWAALVVALMAVGALFYRELQWYRQRYEVNLDTMLQLLTGFDPQTAQTAQQTLRAITDTHARESVTVCLMEYYTLTQQIRAHRAIYGEVLARTGDTLQELMADVLVLAHRYAKLDDFLATNPPARIRQQIAELESAGAADRQARAMADSEIAALSEQLRSIEKMDASRAAFRSQLSTLAQSMESIRVRFAAVRAHPSEDAFRELAFDEALRELDIELEVFEETTAAIGR